MPTAQYRTTGLSWGTFSSAAWACASVSARTVIAIAPNDQLIEKLKSNLQEVRARGGELYVFADNDVHIEESEGVHVIKLPGGHNGALSPILHTLPLQLLSYHAALQKGTDVDKPRNLAKSVTVE
jgi:glucosamine--fructose-6-phosphate aminotransferase (isomerizing)